MHRNIITTHNKAFWHRRIVRQNERKNNTQLKYAAVSFAGNERQMQTLYYFYNIFVSCSTTFNTRTQPYYYINIVLLCVKKQIKKNPTESATFSSAIPPGEKTAASQFEFEFP